MHISRPPSVSARADAVFTGIGKWRRSRSRYPRRELLFYAQRRLPSRVSAHGPLNICSVWHHLCAEASVRQRLCARALTVFGTDSSLAAQNDNAARRRTTRRCSEGQWTVAQTYYRMTAGRHRKRTGHNQKETALTAISLSVERKTRLELATPTLARLCSTN